MQAIISAKSVYKSFNDLKVLKGVDISIQQGEIVSIVGPSGAGKTTLLHILSTLDNADEHPETEVIIDGEDITRYSDKQLAQFRNTNIGFIFQFHQLLPEFTALENVCIPAFINKASKGEAEKKAKELLSFLGLSDRLHHKPNSLSGGEQQRVAVARALINDPKIIFADEPSGNLDSESADRLHQLFVDLKDQFNQTFVIVTHNEELAQMADRKLTMIDGQIKL
jgi:lipoprotein-releasing system ATP-binding protein